MESFNQSQINEYPVTTSSAQQYNTYTTDDFSTNIETNFNEANFDISSSVPVESYQNDYSTGSYQVGETSTNYVENNYNLSGEVVSNVDYGSTNYADTNNIIDTNTFVDTTNNYVDNNIVESGSAFVDTSNNYVDTNIVESGSTFVDTTNNYVDTNNFVDTTNIVESNDNFVDTTHNYVDTNNFVDTTNIEIGRAHV